MESEIVAEDLFRSSTPALKDISESGRSNAGSIAGNASIQVNQCICGCFIDRARSGLTPSGDDILIGYMAGLWCTVRDKSERAQYISSMGETIIHLSEKTNDISRTYLYHAARGQVSSRLADLAQGMCRGDDPELLHKTAETAMSVGHTSGMDTVSGLLLGLSAWEGNQLRKTLE
jgi:hypothetical protein